MADVIRNPLSLPLTDSFLPLTDLSFTFEIILINFMKLSFAFYFLVLNTLGVLRL